MSKNVVDAVIEFSQESSVSVGLIPSRRQIEYTGGYVNNWSTQVFTDYVRAHNSNVVLQRDHGGPGQGDNKRDSGLDSFLADAHAGFDLVHIDPWKVYGRLKEALEETRYFMNQIWNYNPNCEFEVGTEQAIRGYSADELDEFLTGLRKDPLFEKVRYAVIQSGTSISGTYEAGLPWV
jgi:fructose/tagatose bisphosphate aldolase